MHCPLLESMQFSARDAKSAAECRMQIEQNKINLKLQSFPRLQINKVITN